MPSFSNLSRITATLNIEEDVTKEMKEQRRKDRSSKNVPAASNSSNSGTNLKTQKTPDDFFGYGEGGAGAGFGGMPRETVRKESRQPFPK